MKKKEIQKLDENDPLGSFRERFYLPQNRIYLDGNSLGSAPLKAFKEMEMALSREWAEDLIQSWNSAG